MDGGRAVDGGRVVDGDKVVKGDNGVDGDRVDGDRVDGDKVMKGDKLMDGGRVHSKRSQPRAARTRSPCSSTRGVPTPFLTTSLSSPSAVSSNTCSDGCISHAKVTSVNVICLPQPSQPSHTTYACQDTVKPARRRARGLIHEPWGRARSAERSEFHRTCPLPAHLTHILWPRPPQIPHVRRWSPERMLPEPWRR